MPFTFECRQCGQPIQAGEEMSGKRGRCPHCYAPFIIPDPHAGVTPGPLSPPVRETESASSSEWEESIDDMDSSATDDREWRPASRERGDRALRRDETSFRLPERAWNTVRSGVTLMRVGLIVYILTALAVVLLAFVAFAIRADGVRDLEGLLVLLFAVAALTALVALVLIIVGQCMCCAAPEESGAKGLAIGSVICFFVSLGLAVVGLFFSAVSSGQRGAPGAQEGFAIVAAGFALLGFIVFVTNHILFVLFVRASARYFRNEPLAASARTYQILFVIFVVFYVLAVVLGAIVSADGRAGPAAGVFLVIIGIGLVVFALVLFLYFLDLLGRTGTMIGRGAEEPW